MIELGFELREPGPRALTSILWPLVLVRDLMLCSDFHRNNLLLTLTVVPGCRVIQVNCPQFRDDGLFTHIRDDDSETPGVE